jgi:diguanylate cyclase (GGDEF)-like protein
VLSLLRLDSIRSRILLLALLATLVPSLSTAVLTYRRTRVALTETLEGELQGVGSQSARELDLWVKERFYDLRVFVGSFEVTENLDRIRQGGLAETDALARLTNYLTGVQSRSGEFAGLLALNAVGDPIASSAVLPDATALPSDWLASLRLGETQLGAPYWDAELGAVAAAMAVPIESADGRFLGGLIATLTFDPVAQTLTELSPGDAGRIDLISADGRVIVASSPVEGFEPALSGEALADLGSAAGSTREYVDNHGIEMVGTLTPVEGSDWTVLAQLPSAEAYEPITRLRNSTLMLVSFLLLIVGSAAYFIGLLIVRPLANLTAGAGAVAGGDLSVDLPVTGQDEVGYLTKVFNGMVAQLRANQDELSEANSTLREQNAELERISTTDALTSLYNRRYLMGEFDKELNRASRHNRTLAVLMMDVDKFKQYNDNYGHQAGDDVLTGMGQVIRDATREPDVSARYGGEEFIVLLVDCDIHGAVDAAERVRARLAQEVFDGRQVTISIGAAAYPGHGDTPRELIASADAALYEAKDAGRDRVVAAKGDSEKKADPLEVEVAGKAKRRSPEAKRKAAAKKKVAPAKNSAPAKKKSAPAKKKAAANAKAPAKKKAARKKSAPKKKGSAGDTPSS